MKIILITIFLLLTTAMAAAQTTCPPGYICDPRKFDLYGRLVWKDETARLDNVAIQLQHESPSVVAYFLIYAGRNACVNEARNRGAKIKNYLVHTRHMLSRRVVWTDGGYRDDPEVEVWILPGDLANPAPDPKLDRSQVRLKQCASSR